MGMMKDMRTHLLLSGLGLVLTTSACGPANLGSQMAEPPAFEPKGQAKCKVGASQSKPLIVEWASADRTDLEARSRQGGLVVVGYEGCEMRLLSRCHAPGAYAHIPVTTSLASILFGTSPFGLEPALGEAEGRLTWRRRGRRGPRARGSNRSI